MTAPNEARPLVGTERAQQEQTTGDAEIIDAARAQRKEFENLRARAAFARCTLFELTSGGYLLCLGGVTRELPDLRAVAAMLAQIGVRA